MSAEQEPEIRQTHEEADSITIADMLGDMQNFKIALKMINNESEGEHDA